MCIRDRHTYEHERRIEEQEQERRQRRREIRRNNRVNLVYTTVLAICATAVFAICYQYLNLQSDIKTNSTAVVELQNQLNSLKAENNSHESEINAGIDYNAIYDTAVNELGMVYPSRSQVIGYDSKESEYVKPVSYTHLKLPSSRKALSLSRRSHSLAISLLL